MEKINIEELINKDGLSVYKEEQDKQLAEIVFSMLSLSELMDELNTQMEHIQEEILGVKETFAKRLS